MTLAPSKSEPFPTTDWDQIRRSLEELGTESPSMDQLVRRYLPPLRHLLRHRVRPHDIDDVLQGFICEKVLTGKVLKGADARRRFRSYLAKSLMNHVISEAARGGKFAKRCVSAVSLDELEIADQRSEKEDYELMWARQVMVNTCELMRRHCLKIGREDIWDVFEGRLLRPAYSDEEPVPYQELMRKHDLDSVTSTCTLLTTAKRMFHRCSRHVVSQYSSDPEQELTKLSRMLLRRRAKNRPT